MYLGAYKLLWLYMGRANTRRQTSHRIFGLCAVFLQVLTGTSRCNCTERISVSPFQTVLLNLTVSVLSRREVYRILQEEGIDLPRYAVLNRDPDRPEGKCPGSSESHLHILYYLRYSAEAGH